MPIHVFYYRARDGSIERLESTISERPSVLVAKPDVALRVPLTQAKAPRLEIIRPINLQ